MAAWPRRPLPPPLRPPLLPPSSSAQRWRVAGQAAMKQAQGAAEQMRVQREEAEKNRLAAADERGRS